LTLVPPPSPAAGVTASLRSAFRAAIHDREERAQRRILRRMTIKEVLRG
jgi:hypothetical protein